LGSPELLSRHGLEHFFLRWIDPPLAERWLCLHMKATKML
jgi:hypothetical protein